MEKNQKSRDFRDISKITATNVLRPDPYPEKNHRDFRAVIFGAKAFFTGNRVFSIFEKKKRIKNSDLRKRRESFKRKK